MFLIDSMTYLFIVCIIRLWGWLTMMVNLLLEQDLKQKYTAMDFASSALVFLLYVEMYNLKLGTVD